MKRWQVFDSNRELASRLSKTLHISPITAQVLINRGIKDEAEAEKFLNPKLADLKDPFDIPNIEKAALRIVKAKQNNEKITVYGDYDVDGVTATTLLLETFELLGIRADYYIPLRYGEGYSLNKEAVQKLYQEKTNLIVTVDCGVSSLGEVELANSLGMEVVITDHHNLPKTLPPAHAIVNPKLIEGGHPSKDLAGVGVAFKFAWALLRLCGIKDSSFLTGLMDLVALGTIADVVPLKDENRILAIFGIKSINTKKRLGLKHLIEAASIKKEITSNQVNFSLAPRLNAAGRLEHASLSVSLLTAKDSSQAKATAQELSRINAKRQGIGQQIQQEVLALISDEAVASENVIVHSGIGWHPGVIGITASQIVDRFYRPTILIGINEDCARGSARSINGYNIFELLEGHSALLEGFGGHAAAAGFEIKAENIAEFKKRLIESAAKLPDELLQPRIMVDARLDPIDISLSLIKEIEMLAPFGQGNAHPIFMSGKLNLISFRKVGAQSTHLKLKLSDTKANIDVIGFGFGHLADTLTYDKCYDVAYKLETNLWDGFEVAQLNLVDIRPEGEDPNPRPGA